LPTENQGLWEKLGKKRILLNENQHRRLAIKSEVLERTVRLSSRAIAGCLGLDEKAVRKGF
jgi:hypothetical protein